MSTAFEKRWFNAVASIDRCILCGANVYQIAHRNEGKGMGMKTPPWMTAPICPDEHMAIDNGKDMTRDERRALMDRAIVLTHDALIRSGKLKLV
jgi:hypothetical protein